MYIYPGAHHSQHGWRPPVDGHYPISLVNPFVARLQNPSFQPFSALRARRIRSGSTVPRQQGRHATMEEDWLQNISDLEDINYFNSPVLQDQTGAFRSYLPLNRSTRNESSQPVNDFHSLPMSGLSAELTFGSAFGSPKVEDGCSLSDTVLDLHGLPPPASYMGRARTPPAPSQPMLVNMKDIHDPMSVQGGSMRHRSSPLTLGKTCNNMDTLSFNFSTFAPVKLDMSDCEPPVNPWNQLEMQDVDQANRISQWCKDSTFSTAAHQTLSGGYPLTPTSMVSKESGDDASSVASGGNFASTPVSCQTPSSNTSSLSMFPMEENVTQTRQIRHKLPTAPTSVPSASTTPATTKTMIKRARSESSDDEFESEVDDDEFELDKGCGGRQQLKRPCVEWPPVSLAKSSEDEYLLRAREAGMTYKEIRIHGCFSKKESTLRGRYRNLTKGKEERVRKPQWTNKDINLLREFIRKNHGGREPRSPKVSWKQAANYISANGGSYHFGNATCRKKWDEIIDQF